jgi:hypothetical protein
MKFNAEFHALAASQYGLVSRVQALDLIGSRGLDRAQRDHHLVRVHRGVYRCGGVPCSFPQDALAATLAFGGLVAVSHGSAARLWRLEAVASPAPIHVSVLPGRSARLSGIVAHRARLVDRDVTVRFGIPVTSVGRTLLDLAGVVPDAVLVRSIDEALRRHGAGAARLLAQLDDGGHDRRRGRGVLREHLVSRSQHGVPDSVGVQRVFRWIASAGLPAPTCNYPVVVGGRQRFLDLAYPELKIDIEFNGWEHHQMRSRMDDDHARTSELELAGWLVLVVTAAHGQAETIDRIRRGVAGRRRQLRPEPPAR